MRARKAYLTPKKVDAPKTTGNSPSTPELREALDSPLPVSGLTMHVFAAPFKGTAPNASVLFGVELRGRDMKVDPNSKILLSYIAIDANGKMQGRQHRLADADQPASRSRRRGSSRPVCGC